MSKKKKENAPVAMLVGSAPPVGKGGEIIAELTGTGATDEADGAVDTRGAAIGDRAAAGALATGALATGALATGTGKGVDAEPAVAVGVGTEKLGDSSNVYNI